MLIKEIGFTVLDKIITLEKSPINSGVYFLVCYGNNKVYVGESYRINGRLGMHLRSTYDKRLRFNKHLSNSVDKYGINSFKLYVLLQELGDDVRVRIENSIINKLRSELGESNVFNKREKSGTNRGTNTGDDHPHSIKTPIRKQICDLYKKGDHKISELCKLFGISYNTINKILNGSDKKITKKLLSGCGNPSSKLTEGDVINILKEFFITRSRIHEISNKYGVSNATIQNIINGRTYRNIIITDVTISQLLESYCNMTTKEKKSFSCSGENNPNFTINEETKLIVRNFYEKNKDISMLKFSQKLCSIKGVCISRGAIKKIINN